MHGNVVEFCRDKYAVKLTAGTDPEVNAVGRGAVCVVRGGCWLDGPLELRSAWRDWFQSGGSLIGFRCALIQSGK